MARYVVDRATCVCNRGTAPSHLIGPAQCRTVSIANSPSTVATINNTTFYAPFGSCLELSAKAGQCVPCAPVPMFMWVGGSGVFVEDAPALLDTAQLKCLVGGTITIEDAGQGSVEYEPQQQPEAKPWTTEDALRSAEYREYVLGEEGAIAEELEHQDALIQDQIEDLLEAGRGIAGGAASIAERRAEIARLQDLQRQLRAAHSVAQVRNIGRRARR